MSHRELAHLRAWHIGLSDHARPERWIMGTAPVADDLDPLHRSCLSGCHSGSLICSVHHEAKQSGLSSTQQDGGRRTDTDRRRIERHLTEAHHSLGKSIGSFTFEAVPMVSKAHVMEMCSGDAWLEQGANLILFGSPGGRKSHLAAPGA